MRLKQRLAEPGTLITAWSTIPAPDICTRLATVGFDAVTVDLQHGMHTETTAFRAVTDTAAAGTPALLRIPIGRNDLAGRALDAGFEGVIAPMINSLADARAFVEAMKYPPVGQRSWGPSQAIRLHKDLTQGSYFQRANAETLAIAMIETREAVAAVDDILGLDGIDAILVGPSDLSISWTDGAAVDPLLPDMQATVAELAKKALAAGKIAAIYLVAPEQVPVHARMGYRLIAAAGDEHLIRAGAESVLARARG